MNAQSYMDPGSPGRAALIESQLDTLYQVSRVLSRSLDLKQTLQEVLKMLHDSGGLECGMVSLLNESRDHMVVQAVHCANAPGHVRYKPGEGIVGAILQHGSPVVIPRLDQEPRFLDKLGIYDMNSPFLGVPIRSGEGDPVGVFAAQPPVGDDSLIEERLRFLEMVANLIAQAVRLSHQVEVEKDAVVRERDSLKRKVRGDYSLDNMVGHTAAMRKVFDQVRQVAKWGTTVLVRGESGTGKELIANAIHYNSPRASQPFVKLNCAALPDTLLESELFGHEKGAFTGAATQRKGRFERADGGTLFLDEIGEITPAFQAKLLRVLQEGEFERVGGTKTLKVDVRIVAATNKPLEENVAKGDFREDLYYRLNVVPIQIPALRQRREDIPNLAKFLLEKIAKQQARELEITESAVRVLMRHEWPGNVRELENTLERAAIMCEEGRVDRDTVCAAGLSDGGSPMEPGLAPTPPVSIPAAAAATAAAVDLDDPELDERERVIAALEQAGWVQAKAARLLNMTPRQIAYRIQTLNIQMRKF